MPDDTTNHSVSKVTSSNQNWTERQKKSAFLPPVVADEPTTSTSCVGADRNMDPDSPTSTSLLSKNSDTKRVSSVEDSDPNNTIISNASKLRADADIFVPNGILPLNLQQTTQNTDSNTKITSNGEGTEVNQADSSRIYSLSNYKRDRFVSQFKTRSHEPVKLELPYGSCSIAADRLLIADFGDNKSILTDINGCVYNCYQHHSTPKDFAYDPCNPSKVVVSLQKEIIMLDLETKAIIRKTNFNGFYPWKLQFLEQVKIYTASDPTNSKIHFLDETLNSIGGWELNATNIAPSHQATNSKIDKYYPYATHFNRDMKVLCLVHSAQTSQLNYYDYPTRTLLSTYKLLENSKSYSLDIDSADNWFVVDNYNDCLLSFDMGQNRSLIKHTWPSVKKPYAMTFLSDRTLCVTCHSSENNRPSGIAVLME